MDPHHPYQHVICKGKKTSIINKQLVNPEKVGNKLLLRGIRMKPIDNVQFTFRWDPVADLWSTFHKKARPSINKQMDYMMSLLKLFGNKPVVEFFKKTFVLHRLKQKQQRVIYSQELNEIKIINCTIYWM